MSTEPELPEEELRIWIAERCGWKIVAPGRGFTPDGKPGGIIPDYTRDLNAMHEAEKTLSTEPDNTQDGTGFSQRELYVGALEHFTESHEGFFGEVHATAIQKARAFHHVTK